MELTVKERIVLQGLLPKESNFMTLRLMRALREDLSFDDEEIKKLKIKQNGSQMSWDDKNHIIKDIKVGETMEALIVKTLKDMDEKSKLTLDHVTLFEKFIENKPIEAEQEG